MDYLKDFQLVNKSVISKTFGSLKKNYLIIFTGIVYTIISLVIGSVVGILFSGPLSIISGFISYFIQSSIISNYLYLLFNIINYNKFNLNDFKQGFSYFLWKVYGVFFILYLAQLLLSLLGNILGSAAVLLNTVILLLAAIVFNALPETIYLKSYSPSETVLNALDFMKENWLNWIIPNLIFIGLLFYITGSFISGLFNTGINLGFSFSPIVILKYLVGQLIFSFMMIYRGHLYKMLSTSTRRKRMFMNKF